MSSLSRSVGFAWRGDVQQRRRYDDGTHTIKYGLTVCGLSRHTLFVSHPDRDSLFLGVAWGLFREVPERQSVISQSLPLVSLDRTLCFWVYARERRERDRCNGRDSNEHLSLPGGRDFTCGWVAFVALVAHSSNLHRPRPHPPPPTSLLTPHTHTHSHSLSLCLSLPPHHPSPTFSPAAPRQPQPHHLPSRLYSPGPPSRQPPRPPQPWR